MAKILMVLLLSFPPARAMRRVFTDADLLEVRRAVCETSLLPYGPDEVTTKNESFLARHRNTPFVFDRPDFSIGHKSVPAMVRSGMTLEEALRRGPDSLFHFDLYDLTSGHLLEPAGPRMTLASESGSQPLRMIRMHVDDDFKTFFGQISPLVLEDMRFVLGKMPGLRLLISFSEGARTDLSQILERWPVELRERVDRMEESLHYNAIWAQDWSKPLIDSAATLSGRGKLEHYAGREFWARIELRNSAVKFDGGNVVVGDRHVFVATKVVTELVGSRWIPRREALRYLAGVFGKPVIELFVPRSRNEPRAISFHLDLDLAVVRDRRSTAHREVILLQSPFELARVLFGVPVRPLLRNFPDLSADAIARYDDLRRAARKRLPHPEVASARELATHALIQSLDPFVLALDDLKYQYYRTILERNGYAVIDIPGTGAHEARKQESERSKFIDPLRATFPFYNYTNLIVSAGQVLMPNYGIPRLDQAAHGVLEDLGYEVLPMHSAVASICRNGGIRCLSETYREPWSER